MDAGIWGVAMRIASCHGAGMVSPAVNKEPDPALDVIKIELKRHGVRHAWLFGSRARGNPQPDSDWDILVEFGQPPTFDAFMGLKVSLEDRLGAQVDLLSKNACSPRFLYTIGKELVDVA